MLLSEPGDYFIFKYRFEKVKKLVLFEDIDYDLNRSILKREIRWGYEYLSYGKWIEYNNNIFETQIDYSKDKIYIELKYTLISGEPVTIKHIDIYNVDVQGIVLNERSKYFKGYDKGNYKYGVRFVNIDWDPYDKDRVLRLYYQLSYITNKLFGIECYYFRYVPDKDTKDIIFLEYVLYKVKDPVEFKVMVPGNVFTDSKYATINLYGFQFDVPFIVHIDAHYFEEVFGKGEIPRVGDIIYFPYVNKLYEISGIEKNNIESYFQVGLNKWVGKRHVIYSEESENFIEENVLKYEDLFREEFFDDLVDVSDDLQLKPNNINVYNPNDARVYFAGNDYISDYKIDNLGTIISTKYYNIYSFFGKNKSYDVEFVRYKLNDSINVDSNYVFSFWIYLHQENSFLNLSFNDLNFNNNNVTIYYNFVMFNRSKIFKYIKVIKNDNSFFLLEEVDRDDNEKKVQYRVLYGDVDNNQSINDLKLVGIYKYNFLSSENTNMCIYDNDLFYIKLGTFEKYYLLSTPVTRGIWIGCLLALYFERKMLHLNFYRLNNDPNVNDGKLIRILDINDNLLNIQSLNDIVFYIKSSPLMITNIRIYNGVLNEEYYNFHLINRVIEDSSNYLLVDDCRILSYTSYIGNVK